MSREKRNLAIVAPTAYVLGGVQSWLDYLVPGLESLGWNVTVLLVHGKTSNAHRYLAAHPFKRFQLIANKTGSREGRVRALKSAIQLSNADIVLNVNIVDTYEAVARIRKHDDRGLKIVMALHGLNAAFYDDIARYSTLLDGVIATNRLAISAATELSGFPEERACYAPCGVIVPEYSDLKASGNAIDLLYSGRFDAKEKRIMDLPEILSLLDRKNINYRLHLAGAGPDEDTLRVALKKFGDRVEFLGTLTPDALSSRFYKRGSILLIMSPSETGPMVAWEAMSRGVAVVTSRFVGIGLEGSLVDGKTCLVFPVGDVDAAAEAIDRLQDCRLRNSLTDAGRELVLERYSQSGSTRAWHIALQYIQELPAIIKKRDTGTVSPAGRLDRYVGITMAENIRKMFGIHFEHKYPGDEWPHSYGIDEQESFRTRLSALDTI